MSSPTARDRDAQAADGGLAAGGSPDPFEAAVTRAVLHSPGAAGRIRSVASELPRQDRRAWLAMAAAIETRNVAHGLALARTSPWTWLPLVAPSDSEDEQEARLLDHAVRPRVTAGGWWTMLAYPLVVVGVAMLVLAALALTVLPVFAGFFEDFGLALPLATRMAMGLVGFFSSLWQPAAVGLALAAAGAWIGVRWSPRGAAVTGSFARVLASLLAWGEEPDRAAAIAARVVGLASPSQLPSSPCLACGDSLRGTEAAVMLAAFADCQADRCRGSRSLVQWLIGPVAVGVVGLIVGLVVLAVFMPLVSLVQALS